MELDIEWEDNMEEEKGLFSVIPMAIDTEAMAKKVLAMKDLWISRSEDYPFFTLGRCAYLDGKTQAYYDNLKKENEVLIDQFAIPYSYIGDALNQYFKENVFLSNDLRVPGFHVFPSNKKFLKISGKWHQDYPHTTLGLDDIDTYAFTLAIKLPTGGGGMDYKDPFYQQKHFAYNEGDLVVHKGDIIHRIAGMKQYVEGEYRITLQGHIVRKDGILEVFF